MVISVPGPPKDKKKEQEKVSSLALALAIVTPFILLIVYLIGKAFG